MGYFAFICGLLVGIFYLGKRNNLFRIAIYFVFYRYMDKKRFYEYYDLFKREIALQMIEDQGVVYKFSDYLKILKKNRSIAYEKSIEFFEYFAQVVVLRILPRSILPAILFLPSWYWYIAGILVVMATISLYYSIFDRNEFYYWKNCIFINTINDFMIATRWPKESDRPKSSS